jgi:hypothetical protein
MLSRKLKVSLKNSDIIIKKKVTHIIYNNHGFFSKLEKVYRAVSTATFYFASRRDKLAEIRSNLKNNESLIFKINKT